VNGQEARIEPIEKGMAAPMTEISLRMEVTDLLLGRPGGVRIGRHSKRPTLEQGAVLERIEAALEAYMNFFYPPAHR
jgi:hypothetical protein